MKGKYAAKAANRLVALDNELLAEKTRELEAANDRINDLESQLGRRQADIDAEIIRRADALAVKQIEVAKAATQQVIADKAGLGVKCWQLFKKYKCRVGVTGGRDEFLREYMVLFGAGGEVSTLLDIADDDYVPLPNRRARRRSLKKLDQLQNETSQANSTGGVVTIGWDE